MQNRFQLIVSKCSRIFNSAENIAENYTHIYSTNEKILRNSAVNVETKMFTA